MSKLLKIVVSVIALSLLYLWMSSVFQSCSGKSKDSESQVDLVEELPDEEIIDVSDEDFFEDDAEYLEGTATAETFEELEENMLAENPVESYDTNEETTASTPSGNYQSSHSGQGSFMLISGNYLVEANAQQMVQKLKNLGYSNAEIVIFDRSQYHTVIASRFSSYSTALQSADNLKQKGVDCYVKKRS